MHITYDLPVAIDDIIEAKQRLAGRIYKIGMPRSNYFSERCKGEIFLKFENMQRTGSFKIRGAFNKLSSLTDAEKRKAWWPVLRATMRKGFPSPARCWVSTVKW
ncbi:hypothetical protein ACNKHR_16850 [Shigella flexneri]